MEGGEYGGGAGGLGEGETMSFVWRCCCGYCRIGVGQHGTALGCAL